MKSFLASTLCLCGLLCSLTQIEAFAEVAADHADVSWQNWQDLRDTALASAGRDAKFEDSRLPALAVDAPTIEPPAEDTPSPSATPGNFAVVKALLPIPEASTLALALLGTIGLALLRRRR